MENIKVLGLEYFDNKVKTRAELNMESSISPMHMFS